MQQTPFILSPRLQAVADLVPPCNCLYDIGTDHAWLPISLVSQKHCRQAVAADLRAGPLERAARHVRESGLDDRITLRLTDGLQDLAPGPDDVVVLSGLGGHEIMRIIGGRGRDCRCLVLQPMKTLPELRSWLYAQGYRIEQEQIACDRGRYYPVLRAVYCGSPQAISLLAAWVGPDLLLRKPDLLKSYLRHLQPRLLRHGRSRPELLELADQIAALIRAE